MQTPPSGFPRTPGPEPEVPAGVWVSHVRGVILTVIKEALQGELEVEGWKALASRLSESTRLALEHPHSDYEWIPMQVVIEIAREATPLIPGQDPPLLRGRLYADQLMTKNHQWMLKVMTPELFIRECPRIFSFYHRGGAMTVEHLDPNRARLGLRAKGPGTTWFSALLPTWFERSLEWCGAQSVEVVHEPPDPDADPLLHHYWLSWASSKAD